jgi:hypothetical protein
MDGLDIQGRIRQLISEEHRLRTAYGAGMMPSEEEHARLGLIQVELDECWDLLRERGAKGEFGEDADEA